MNQPHKVFQPTFELADFNPCFASSTQATVAGRTVWPNKFGPTDRPKALVG